MKIAYINVGGMYSVEKMENVLKEFEQSNLDGLVITETHFCKIEEDFFLGMT